MKATNLKYDLLPPLLSALVAKSPLVGIPLPGNAPLILSRTKLQAALRGVEPMRVAVEGQGQWRYLRVEGMAKNCIRTKMRMLSLSRDTIRQGTRRAERDDTAKAFWAFCDARPTQPRQRGTAKLALLEKKIAKAREQKQRMMQSLRWAKPTAYGEDARKAILAWYLGKQSRRDPKFRDPLTRINEGQRRGWWIASLLAPSEPPPTPAQRYAFLRYEPYLSIREELRGLETIKNQHP